MKIFVLTAALFALSASATGIPSFGKDEPILKTLDVTAFGAVGDGMTLDTKAIQTAVDAAGKGGKVVRFAPGVYLSGTIQLKNGVTLLLDKGATLLGSQDAADYTSIDPFVDGVNIRRKGHALVIASGAKNVGIEGEGTMDGNGETFRTAPIEDRPFLLRFDHCTGVRVHGISLLHAAAWTQQYFDCDDVSLDDVTVRSHGNGNNDGIDIDASRHVEISDCDVSSDDDALCLKTTIPKPCSDILVTNCRLSSHWGAIKFGTESMGPFQNIAISECVLHDTAGGGIKIFSVDGAVIHNMTIRNITMTRVDMPIMIRLGARLRVFHSGASKQQIGTIDGVTIDHVTATDPAKPRVNPPTAILIAGIPGHPIMHLQLSDISIETPGGGAASDAARTVPENEDGYPEYTAFPPLPAYGAFVRHASGVVFKNVKIISITPDARPVLTSIDVSSDSKIEDVSVGTGDH